MTCLAAQTELLATLNDCVEGDSDQDLGSCAKELILHNTAELFTAPRWFEQQEPPSLAVMFAPTLDQSD